MLKSAVLKLLMLGGRDSDEGDAESAVKSLRRRCENDADVKVDVVKMDVAAVDDDVTFVGVDVGEALLTALKIGDTHF